MHSQSSAFSSFSQSSQSLVGDLARSGESAGGSASMRSAGGMSSQGSADARAGLGSSQSNMSSGSNYSSAAVAAAVAAIKSPNGRPRKPTEEEVRKQEIRIRKREQLVSIFKAYEQFSRDEERKLKDAVRRRILADEAKFVAQLAELESQRPHADAVGRFISEHDERMRRKQQHLFAEWENLVFKPIQDQIQAKLGEVSSEEIAQRRQVMFQEFIDQTNKKDTLFRDIIIESEYNPLKAHDHTVHYSSKRLIDPCKRDLMKAKEEKSLMSQNLEAAPAPILSFTGPSPAAPVTLGSSFAASASLARGPRTLAGAGLRSIAPADERCPGRETMEVTLWNKAEATPYGHFAGRFDAEGELIPIQQRPNPGQKSRVVFDHFNIDKSKDLASKEFKEMRTKGF